MYTCNIAPCIYACKHKFEIDLLVFGESMASDLVCITATSRFEFRMLLETVTVLVLWIRPNVM